VTALALHITGASGSGVTTLGHELSRRTGAIQLDTDNFYWLPTNSKFTAARETSECLRLIEAAITNTGKRGWILSGSIGDWGAPLVRRFQLVVFIYTDANIRIARLRQRGIEREGAEIEPGGPRERQYREFLEWAASYDEGGIEGRTLAKHEAWLSTLRCPVLRVDGAAATEALADQVLATLTAAR
jgi:adenylate kinase family enzyme